MLPSLKKPGLDSAFKNFRPVRNLSYISKLSERAGAEQFLEHLTANNLDSQLQTAYKQQHSKETALLKVKNDILMSIDEQHVTLLVLLDLSAAFDTIHHDTVIGRLESDLGITENALAWFKSYLSDRVPACLCKWYSLRSVSLKTRCSLRIMFGPLAFHYLHAQTVSDR